MLERLNLDTLETGLKLLRLVQAMELSDVAQGVEDAGRVLQFLALAPKGASVAQLASLLYLDESYLQGLLNVLERGGLVDCIDAPDGVTVLYVLAR